MKVLMGILLASVLVFGAVAAEGPYMATGIKIGEVKSTEALVWVRLTKNPVRMPEGSGMPTVLYKDPDTGELKEREGRPNRDP